MHPQSSPRLEGSRQTSVRAALDRLAAEDGPNAVYGEACDRRLDLAGYTAAERLEVARQLAAGYASEAYSAASPIAGTPPAELIQLAATAHGEVMPTASVRLMRCLPASAPSSPRTPRRTTSAR